MSDKQVPHVGTFKIIVVGDSNVGKSTFINKMVGKQQKSPTVGFVTNKKDFVFDEKKYTLVFWDTSGQQMQAYPVAYMKSAVGVFLMFSLTDQKSFERMKYWLDMINGVISIKLLTIIMLGNKVDDLENRVIKRQNAVQFARDRYLEYREVSGKTGQNCQSVLQMLVIRMDEQCKQEAKKINQIKNLYVNVEKKQQKKEKSSFCTVY